MRGQPSKAQASALLVAIGHYDDPGYESLNEVSKAAQALAELLAKGGYAHTHSELLMGGDSESIGTTLDEWFRTAAKGDTVVVYWAGHGKKEGDGHFLATRNSPSIGLNGYNALRPSELGSMAAKSAAEKVLILLDTCYSGAAAGEIADRVRTVLATRPEQPGRWPTYAVIASAHPLKKAQEAVFCKALTQVLSQPLTNNWLWTDNDKLYDFSRLKRSLRAF